MINFTRIASAVSRDFFEKHLTTLIIVVAMMCCLNSYAQTDDFTDGNFTASPVWSGNTADFSIQTATPYIAGGATTDASYLASSTTVGNLSLTTPSTEVSEWKFSLGTGSFSPATGNYFGVILMSNVAVSGSITATSWNGYYLRIGVDGTTDPIELWVKNGAGTGTKVGNFPSSPNYNGTALNSGLNVRVTRSAAGVFELFYSTGFTYAATPTTSAGTLTNNTITTSSFFGVYSLFTNPTANRRVFLDNVVLGSGPTINGTITAGEYGVHTNGSNQEGNTYLTWDDNNLYVAVASSNTAEAFVLYLDKDPQIPVNGGTNANGTNVGFNYDNTSFAELQYRADLVMYVKNGYREYRTADGSNGWSAQTSGFGSYAETGGNTREFSIPWSAIGGKPSAFNFFSYVTSSGGFVYGQTPTENAGGNIGTGARYSRYYTVSSTTSGSSTLPFSRNSYVFNSATDVTSFGPITAYDFTMNTSGRFLSRTGNTAGNWVINGNLVVGNGTIYLGSGGGSYGTTSVAGNLNLLGGSFNMDQTTAAMSVTGNVFIASGASLVLSGTSGGDFNLAGNWSNSGTFTPNSRLVTFNGTTAQTLTGATTFDFLTLNNTTGLTLNNSIVVNQTLGLTLGKITLGANDLTVGSAGTITGASATNYVVTNGAGQLKRTVGASNTLFAVGNAAYNPITLNNSGTSDVYGIVAIDGTFATPNDNTRIVNRRWQVTEAVAGGSNLAIEAQYNSGELAANFAAATTPYIGYYNGSIWSQVGATLSGANPFVATSSANSTPSDLTSGTNYFAIGKDAAFIPLPATQFVITSISPATPQAGSGFNVTVQSQNALNASANVTASTSFTLTTNGNAGAISGTVTGTIVAGTNSIVVSGVILATTGTGATITATQTSGDPLTAGTSAAFNVVAGADHLTFVGVPATGNINTNLTSFTVEARRPDNSVDTGYTANVTIAKASGPGNLAGTVTVAAVAGVATFNAAQFDAIGSYTLTTTSGVLTPDTSGTIVVTLAPVVLAAWDLFGAGSATTNPTTYSATTFNVNLDNSGTLTDITRGPGAPPSNGGNSFRTTGFQNNGISTSNTDYFQTTLKTDDGYSLSLSLITANLVGTATFSAAPGVSNQFAYSLDGTNFTLINSPVIVSGTTPAAMPSIDLSGISALQNISSGTTVYFRFYASGQTATGGWGFSSPTSGTNGLAYNGNILCVEPIAYAVTGGGNGCATTGVAVGLSNSQVGVSYQLKIGGTNTGSPVVGTGAAISFGNQLVAGTYSVEAFNTHGTCNLSLAMTGSVAVTLDPASVAGTVSANQTICENTQPTDISLTGNTGTIQWESSTDNSTFTAISGETAATLAGATIGNLTTTTYYRAVVTSGTCAAATSAVVTITVTPNVAASVSIAAIPSGAICSGTSVTFTATPTNGGATPTYQWKINGTDVSGETASTFTTSTLANGNVVTVVMTSNANCVTGSPATSAGTTMSVSNTIDYANLQFPGSSTICQGASLTAYGQVYEPGVTPGAGSQGAGITVEFGYDTANTNPNTWTNWFAATFNSFGGGTNNDEYQYTFTPAISGTLYYTFRYKQGACDWQYGGYNAGGGGFWNGTTNNSGVLTVNPLPTASISGNNGPVVCSGNDITFSLTGTSGAVVTYNLNGGSNTTVTLTGGSATVTVSGATATQTLNLVSLTDGTCPATLSGSSTVVIESTTWDGTTWSNGTPSSTKAVSFTGNYTIGANFDACSISVSNNAVVSVTSGFNVTLNGAITVASGSSFTLNNNANLFQSNASAVNTGNIIVKRQSNPLIRLDYTMWSSPVTGQGLYAFSPFTFANRFYVYDTSTNLYNNSSIGFNVTGTNAAGVNGTDTNNVPFTTGKGYLIRLPYNHPTAPIVFNGSFTGVPNNGTKTITLANVSATQQFNAVGNPYPSPIDIDQFATDNASNIEPTLYFWRKTNNAASPSYCTWNTASATFGDNGEAYTNSPNGVIQTGQGFIVEAKDGATSLEFNNGQRIADNANQFFRANTTATPTNEAHRIWLNLTGTGAEYSQAVIGYFTNATSGADAYDSKYFNDGAVALNMVIGTTEYVIQGRPTPFQATDIVPLNYKVTTAGNYTFAIDHVDGLFTGGAQAVFIKDNQDGSYHNLSSPYTFTSAAGTFANRFELVYQTALTTNDNNFTANSINVIKQQNDVVVRTAGTTMQEVTIFDIRGRVLVTKNNINASETKINVGTTNQVLLVQVTTVDGVKATKKVVN